MEPDNISSKSIVGHCHLLQTMAPGKLIGTLGAWIEPDSVGWVNFVFSNIEEFINFQLSEPEILITLEVDTASKLAGLLLLLVAQNKEFRKLQQLAPPEKIDLSVNQLASLKIQGVFQNDPSISKSEQRGKIELRLPKEINTILISLEDDHIDLQLREELAYQVGLLIIEQLGILTAHLSLKILQDSC